MNKDQSVSLPPNLEKSSSKSTRLRWILVIVIILVIAGVAISYYQFIYKKEKPTNDTTTQVDETTDWSTFEDKVYGFSIKYPPIWQVDEKDISDVKFNKQVGKDITLGTNTNTMVEIQSAADAGSVKLEDWAKETLKETKYTPENILIGGKEALATKIISENQSSTAVFLIADSTKYYLTQVDVSLSTAEYFDKMLKTFKLIAKEKTSNNTADTSNQANILSQTYYNEKYGYSLKYPDDWLQKDLSEEGDEHILDQIGFVSSDQTDDVLFNLKVSDRTVDNEITLHKAGLDQSEIVSENAATLGGFNGGKIVSAKGTIETTALFLKRDDWTYIIYGQSKNPQLNNGLYFDQMIASINFSKT